jgi:hypothetical protein
MLMRRSKDQTIEKTKQLWLFMYVYMIEMGCSQLMYLCAGDNVAPEYGQSVLKYLDSLETFSEP